MDKKQLLGMVRHALTFIGGMLIMKGTIDATEWAELSGSLIAVVGGIWSIMDKLNYKGKIK
jgi:flagellar motor component MotA